MVRPNDTSPDAWARQLSAVRRLTGQERAALAAAMSDDARTMARDGIRNRHPDWQPAAVEVALEDLLLGHDLAAIARRGRRATGG